MSDHITLMGAEDVRRAAGAIADAALQMRGAAAEISQAVRDLREVLETDRRERGDGGEKP